METNKRPQRRSSIIIPVSNSPCPRKQDKIFSTKFSMSVFVKRVNKLSQRQRDAVERTGFGNLLLIGNRMIAKTLLNALMERWHSKKRAFVLAKGGVISITPLDVALILGLRVTGQPVNIIRESDLPFLEVEGKYGATLWNRKVTVASINERLEKLGEKDDDEFVRLFLLFTFGTLLFPNTSEKVDSRYLYLLQDIDDIRKFAWGVAVLDDLADWLSRRKEENVQYVGGCLILLQIWLYEHINIARPSLRNHPIKFPRACRWDNSKSHLRDWSSLQFRNLQTNQISWFLDLTLEELELEIVKELLASQREMGTTHIDLDSEAGGALGNEDCCSPLRSSSPDKASTSMGNQIFPKHGVHCSQDKENPIAIVTNTDMSNNERDGALANEKQNPEFISVSDVSHSQGDDVLENVHSCQQVSQKGRSDQSRPSFNFELPLMTDQHYSPPATSCQQEKQNPNFIVMDNDVCNNQRNGVLSNEREKQIPNLISLNNDVCNNQGDGALVDNDFSNQLSSICDLASTSSGDQCSSPSTSCSPQMIQRHTFIDIGSDNGCSNQLRPICDLACTSLGDQYSSPSASCSPQVRQRLNFIDLSSDDNEDEYTSEDCVMKREISKLRKENNNLKKETKEKERKLSEATKIEEENTKLRKEVESLKYQNLLHLSAFNIVSRLNSVVFSEIADEVLGTN